MAKGNKLFDYGDAQLPLGDWVEGLVEFLLDNAQGLFDGIDWVIKVVTNSVEWLLLETLPAEIIILGLVVVALWRVGMTFAGVTLSALFIVLFLGLWEQTMASLALVLSATLLSLIIGIPLGIWAARNDVVEHIIRPALDFMQTMPAFVYLIPAAMFFGLGKVPGAIATVIFAMPPAVRLTNLGIRQVPKEMVEAGLSFGCTPRQLLLRVQIPNAMPSIMAGVNQTIMLALSMVVIASMIGAGGLGNEVLKGIQRLDVGLGFEAGLGVVVLAIILDRITQSFQKKQGQQNGLQRLKALFIGGSDTPKG